MKIMLCNPPTGFFLRDERCQIDMNTRVAENMREPIQLLYLAGLVKSLGYEVALHDYSFPRYTLDDVCKDIEAFKPEWFYMETTQGTFTPDLEFMASLRQKGYNMKFLLKAPFVDRDYLQEKLLMRPFFKDISCYFITRDAEDTLKEVLAKGREGILSSVFYWHNGEIEVFDHTIDQAHKRFKLDDYPIPPRELLNKFDYVRPDTGEPIAYIYTAKGCPYPCVFCSAPVYLGKTINMRSVESVIAEIENCVHEHGINNFFFRSDTFTFEKKWVLSFCAHILDKGLVIRWGTNSRVDKIDREMVEAMKKAGCDIIGFGVESGSDRILEHIKKVITTAQIKAAHRCVKEAGIKSFFHTIIGFPWDTHETIKETQRFLLQESPDFIEVNVPYPLRGTELFAIAKEHGLFISDDLEAYSHVKPILRTFTLTPEEVSRYRKQILRSFYLRPHYIFSKLCSIKNPKVFINYMKWGVAFLGKLRRA
ncbi:MAG: radical SAM protein [Candidatus Omnitrophica bacterium]|nr:radical SAM protein [Candidatus Omnitrophota bacterium]